MIKPFQQTQNFPRRSGSIRDTPTLFLSAFFITILPFLPANASIILGTGTGALIGGDITDPENDIDDTVASNGSNQNQGMNWNWAEISTSDRPYFGGEDAPGNNQGSYDIFDNFLSGSDGKYCCGGAPWQVSVRFDDPYVLTHFTLSSSNDSPGRDPDVWQIRGSNNGTVWTDIFSYDMDDLAATNDRNYVGNSPFTARNQVIRYDSGSDFALPASYTWFQINVESNAGWAGAAGEGALAELELFGTAIPEPHSFMLLGIGGILLYRRRR